jgi:hypothetical protein
MTIQPTGKSRIGPATAAGLLALLLPISAPADGFTPPRADEIVSYANNPVFHYNTCDIYQELPETVFLQFLKQGKVLPFEAPKGMDGPYGDTRLQGPTTFHEPMNDWARSLVKLHNEGNPGACGRRSQGIAATSKAIYFWVLVNDKVLWISDEQGPGCYLRIDATNWGSLAADGGGAVHLMPSYDEIAIVNNTPQTLDDHMDELHVPIEPDRVKAFFSEGTNVYKEDAYGFFLDSAGQRKMAGFMNCGPLSLPKDIPAKLRAAALASVPKGGENSSGDYFTVEGALLTKTGKVLFWRLWSDSVLEVWDQKGNTWALVRPYGSTS